MTGYQEAGSIEVTPLLYSDRGVQYVPGINNVLFDASNLTGSDIAMVHSGFEFGDYTIFVLVVRPNLLHPFTDSIKAP